MRAKLVGKKFKLNCRERSKRKTFEQFCTFPPNSSKLKSDYSFSFRKRTNNLFQAFSRSEYLSPKSAPPPPLRIKCLSPKHRVYLPTVMAQNTEYLRLYRNRQLHCDFMLTSKIGIIVSISEKLSKTAIN